MTGQQGMAELLVLALVEGIFFDTVLGSLESRKGMNVVGRISVFFLR